METVTVGDPRNAPDTRYDIAFPPSGVPYVYEIGRCEVTANQYCEFLNAVASSDPYGLYSTGMDSWTIVQSGSPGSYSYEVSSGCGNLPVNRVGWGDAARFVNWLHNGQPTGAQGLTTTEDGSYYLNGATSDADLALVVREPDATWVIPSESEWYKAAYYKGGSRNAGYWDYPTQSNSPPTAEAPPGGSMTVASANYLLVMGTAFRRTDVGAYSYKPSTSAYGTFDQGGNVFEWHDTAYFGTDRSLRGGAYHSEAYFLRAATRVISNPTAEHSDFGFRVAYVPEPTTLALLALGALRVVRRRRAVLARPSR
jgi:formylglycine-generating enzyme required for sulfatase activity